MLMGGTRPVRVAIIVCALAATFASRAQAQAPEFRAFWVDAWGPGLLDQSEVETLLGKVGDPADIGEIRKANCNAVLVQVRRRADVCYPSGMSEPYFSGLSPSNFNALQAMIAAAHDTTGGKQRVEVHAWIVTFATSGNGVTSSVYYAHNNPADAVNYWPTQNNAGAETDDKAFDPGHPHCLQYITDVCMDLVRNFDIDGLHYDYIRYTANNQGYNPTSIARYNARYGVSGQPSSGEERFKQWRRDQVTALVRKVYANIQAVKPWVKQSGSFVTWNPSPAASTRSAFMATRPYYDVYSDWDSWMQEGIVDLGVPMTYYNWDELPGDYTRWMNFEKDRKGNRFMIVGPGIYKNTVASGVHELELTRDPSPAGNYAQGFCGYSYRTPSSSYDLWPVFRDALIAAMTPTPTSIPDIPWKTSPTKGHIMGTVTYSGTGAWADGATVTAAGPETRSMTCDGTGFYAFIDLTPGVYTVTASAAGYTDSAAVTTVALGQVTGNMYPQNLVLGSNAAPVISGIAATSVSSTTATVTWNTDTGSSSRVEYGLTTSYGSLSPLDGTGVTAHSVVLGNLTPGTLYHCRVISANAKGSMTSGDYTFTTIASGVPDLIVDNTHAQFHVLSGTWSTSSSGGGFYGTNYRNKTTSSTVTGQVEWVPNVATAGSYTVYVYYKSGTTRPNNAKYVVTHAAGTTEYTVNQQNNGAMWVLLGTHTFSVGTAGRVTLSDQAQTGKTIVADAVKLVYNGVVSPTITQQPVMPNACVGRSAQFSVTATGTPPLRYQWQKNGADIGDGGHFLGTQTPALSLLGADATDVALYSCVVTNAGGSVSSNTAPLTLNTPASLALQPTRQTACPYGTAQFTVTPAGDGPFTYQWQKNGVNLANAGHYSGVTTPTLTVSNVDRNDLTTYRCIVSGACNAVTSDEAWLAFKATTGIDQQPVRQYAHLGGVASFQAHGAGDGEVSYLWQKNGASLDDGGHYSGAHTMTLTISNADLNDVADYRCVITGGCSSVTTGSASLTITPATDIDADGDVDGADFGILAACFNGTGNPISTGCLNVDLNGDSSVDGTDYGLFAACFNGTGNVPACGYVH